MAAKKRAGTTKTKRDNELSKLLSTNKVLRLVAQMGADPQEFTKMYLADTSRVRNFEFTAEEEKAIKAWIAAPNSRNMQLLMAALGTTNGTTAFKRVMAYQDLHG